MENMNNPYGRASASPRQASLPPVATQKNSASSIKRGEAGGVGVSSIKREDAGGVGVEPWSDMKLEKKRSIIKREAKPRGQGSSDALRVTTKQQDPRDDLIDDLKSDLEKLRKSCICSICQELLFEPYFFQCGHVYCYGCITSWIGQAKSKKARFCPQCRKVITAEPFPAYVIRDMIEIFVNRAEIMSPATGAELRTQKQQNKLQIDRDKAPGGPGLFRGIFSTKVLYGVKDPEDGVIRCPNCNWEVHAGRCENPDCGVRVRQARDGDGYDSEESDGSGSETEEGSEPETDGGIEMPMRWAESIVGETEDDWEDAVDEEDADGFDDVDDVSSRRRNRNLYGAAVMNRNGTVGPGYDDSEEDDESDSDGTVGSLRDFVADDSPEVRRPVRRPGTGGPWALPSSSPYASSPARQPIPQARRQNARPVIADDDDDDEESSTSSAPARRSNRRFQNARHVSLSSDYEDDEQSLLGYQALIGNQTDHTATEDEDDGVSSPPVRAMGGRRNIGQRTAGPGSVFSVPEEDDEDEFADADESEDQDGDITMGDTPPRRITGGNTATGATRPSTRRPSNGRDQTGTRIQAGSSRNQPIELDSASESEVALSRRRTRRSAPASNGPRNSSYFTNHQRNSSGSGRGNRRATSEVNPTLMGLFAQHGQQLRETQFNSLGRNSSSVSPARTLTPVQRAMSGRRSSAGSRGSTPLRAMYSSPPPPFSPMQSPELTSGPSGISPSSPPAQSPTSNNNNNPWLRSFSLSPRLGSSGNSGQSWGILSALQNQPQRIASPMGVRVRSRASNARLRGNGSRNGYRANSATPSTPHAVSFAGGASIAGVMGRAMAQPAQQAQRPQQHVQHQHVQHVQHQHQPHQNQQQQQQQQQQAHRQQQPLPQPVPQVQNQQVQQQTSQPPPIQQHTRPQPQPQQRTQQQQQQQGGVRLGGGSNSGGSPRVLTAEDIRARGEQIRQNQLRMINGGGSLAAASSAGRGNRLGALIGGGAAGGGGPMLVIGNEDDNKQDQRGF